MFQIGFFKKKIVYPLLRISMENSRGGVKFVGIPGDMPKFEVYFRRGAMQNNAKFLEVPGNYGEIGISR